MREDEIAAELEERATMSGEGLSHEFLARLVVEIMSQLIDKGIITEDEFDQIVDEADRKTAHVEKAREVCDALSGGPSFDADGCIDLDTQVLISGYTSDAKKWLDFCYDAWDQKYGRFDLVSSESEVSYHFITGGWSNNEAVMQAMEENTVMWANCWQRSERGGLYVFTIEGD